MDRNRDIRSRIVGVNVPRWERLASVIAGGVLARWGLRRMFGVNRRERAAGTGMLLELGSAYLVARGITGRCGLYRMRAVRKGIEFRRAVTIQCSPQQVYDLWRDPRNLPRFMQHVKSVEVISDKIARWTVQEGPKTLEWQAELVEDTPPRRLRWQSLPGGDIDNEGIIDIYPAPAERGTVCDVRMRYVPPGGLFVMGMLSGILRAVPGMQLAEELARLRMLLETGELATGASNPSELSPREKVLTAAGV